MLVAGLGRRARIACGRGASPTLGVGDRAGHGRLGRHRRGDRAPAGLARARGHPGRQARGATRRAGRRAERRATAFAPRRSPPTSATRRPASELVGADRGPRPRGRDPGQQRRLRRPRTTCVDPDRERLMAMVRAQLRGAARPPGALPAGDGRARSRRGDQHRLDGRLPADPRHRHLRGDEGIRAQPQRGGPRGAEGNRGDPDGGLSRAR